MRPFDVVRFEAEIGSDRFAFDAERADVVALGDSPQTLARTLADEYRAMADELRGSSRWRQLAVPDNVEVEEMKLSPADVGLCEPPHKRPKRLPTAPRIVP